MSVVALTASIALLLLGAYNNFHPNVMAWLLFFVAVSGGVLAYQRIFSPEARSTRAAAETQSRLQQTAEADDKRRTEEASQLAAQAQTADATLPDISLEQYKTKNPRQPTAIAELVAVERSK